MRLILRTLFIGNIIFLLCSPAHLFAESNYVPGELFIKLRDNKVQASSIQTLDKLPDTTKTLSQFLGAKSIAPLYKGKLEDTPLSLHTGARSPQEIKKSRRQMAIKSSGIGRIYKLTFAGSENMEALARQFIEDPNIEFAEPNYYIYSFVNANDPDITASKEWHITHLACQSGWDVTTGSAQTIVAVIDSGINTDHPDLTPNLWINPGDSTFDSVDNDSDGYVDDVYGWNFISNTGNVTDDHGHGTRVSGIISAGTNNGIGIAGIDWGAKIMTLKVLNSNGTGTVENIIDAIYYSINKGVDVINMSLGTSAYSSSFKTAINAAYNSNILNVAAMGNDGSSTVYYPAGFSEVIGVGATDDNDELASFSTYGSGSQVTELTAPGVSIYSTIFNGSYGYIGVGGRDMSHGTSFASPMVAGLGCLLFALQPTMNVDDMRIRMHLTAIDLGPQGPDKYFGNGRISVENALKNIHPGGKGLAISQLMNFPNPVNDHGTYFSFYLNDYASITIQVYTPHGELIKVIDGGITNGNYHKVFWDCKDDTGNVLPNGGYIYVVIAEGGQKEKIYKKGKMAVLN